MAKVADREGAAGETTSSPKDQIKIGTGVSIIQRIPARDETNIMHILSKGSKSDDKRSYRSPRAAWGIRMKADIDLHTKLLWVGTTCPLNKKEMQMLFIGYCWTK